MSNPLDSFTVDRLELIIRSSGFEPCDWGEVFDSITFGEILNLCKIALAAKQAEPDYYIVRTNTIDAWGPEAALDVYDNQLDASKCKDDHGGFIIPFYTTPPAPQLSDSCQWSPDDDFVYSTNCGNEWQFTEGGLEDNQIKFCPYCGGKISAPEPE